jgi:hypothetical protein
MKKVTVYGVIDKNNNMHIYDSRSDALSAHLYQVGSKLIELPAIRDKKGNITLTQVEKTKQ